MRLPSTVLILALAAPASIHAQAPASPPAAANSGPAASGGAPARRPARSRRGRASLVARNVSFQANPDGSARCAVHVSGAVSPTTNASPRRFEVVLAFAVAATRNDMHPLEAEFFDTAMRRARLTRRGRDLVLVIELRAEVTPTMHVENDPSGGVLVVVDLPAGRYRESAPAPDTGSVRPSQTSEPEQNPRPSAPPARSAHDDDERPPGMP